MRTFKRDNWTNEQIISFLKGQKIKKEGFGDYNFGICSAIAVFEDFMRPENESGAMGYCVEENEIYHIGPMLPR